jgi:hypothetical protein
MGSDFQFRGTVWKLYSLQRNCSTLSPMKISTDAKKERLWLVRIQFTNTSIALQSDELCGKNEKE